jgi:hypothetical protein
MDIEMLFGGYSSILVIDDKLICFNWRRARELLYSIHVVDNVWLLIMYMWCLN